jgi:hypothetical protein
MRDPLWAEAGSVKAAKKDPAPRVKASKLLRKLMGNLIAWLKETERQ